MHAQHILVCKLGLHLFLPASPPQPHDCHPHMTDKETEVRTGMSLAKI